MKAGYVVQVIVEDQHVYLELLHPYTFKRVWRWLPNSLKMLPERGDYIQWSSQTGITYLTRKGLCTDYPIGNSFDQPCHPYSEKKKK